MLGCSGELVSRLSIGPYVMGLVMVCDGGFWKILTGLTRSTAQPGGSNFWIRSATAALYRIGSRTVYRTLIPKPGYEALLLGIKLQGLGSKLKSCRIYNPDHGP